MKMDKIEKKFVNSKQHAQQNIKIMEQLIKNIDIKKIRNVLEIGCGAGITAAYLHKKYDLNIIGTDVDPDQILVAKKYHKESRELKFVESDATGLPFNEQQFDMVLSFFVMRHINDWGNALKEINRVLKTKGYLVFYDIAFSRFTSGLFKNFIKKYGVYSIDDILSFLRIHKIKPIYQEKPHWAIVKHYPILFQKK